MSGRGFIAVEPEGCCAVCKKIAELRPYGPNGERICYQCGQKNKEVTERQMSRYLFGKDIH